MFSFAVYNTATTDGIQVENPIPLKAYSSSNLAQSNGINTGHRPQLGNITSTDK